MTSENGRCTSDYDSHDRQWIDGDLVCVDCGLVDLDAARIIQRFAEAAPVPLEMVSPRLARRAQRRRVPA